MNLSNVNIPDGNDSAYWYLSSITTLQPNNLRQEKVVSYLDELHKDKDEWKKIIGELWKRSSFEWNEAKLEKVYEDYPDAGRNKIGVVFYPMMVQITGVLNDKYANQLTTFSQIVTDVKQLYLDVIVKKGVFQFKTVPFKTAKFIFEQKGSIPNPFNANLGIRILK